jgi:hypothetical protein
MQQSERGVQGFAEYEHAMHLVDRLPDGGGNEPAGG